MLRPPVLARCGQTVWRCRSPSCKTSTARAVRYALADTLIPPSSDSVPTVGQVKMDSHRSRTVYSSSSCAWREGGLWTELVVSGKKARTQAACLSMKRWAWSCVPETVSAAIGTWLNRLKWLSFVPTLTYRGPMPGDGGHSTGSSAEFEPAEPEPLCPAERSNARIAFAWISATRMLQSDSVGVYSRYGVRLRPPHEHP